MGVPLITLAGDSHASRVGVSLLHAVGLDELIAPSPDAYRDLAIELAQDPERIRRWHRSLRQRLLNAPLANPALIARSIEAAYRDLWRHWCQMKGQPASPAPLSPEPLTVAPASISGASIQAAQIDFNHGRQEQRQGHLFAAMAAYRKAVELNPRYFKACNNLGLAHTQIGDLPEAIRCFRHALAIQPNHPTAHHNLLLYLNDLQDADPQQVFREHRAWAQRMAPALPSPIPPHTNRRDGERALRIGYVSADFRTHSVSYFFEPLLAAHDRSQFHVICYSNNPTNDATTERLKTLAADWRQIHQLDDEQAANLIRKDKIDILVDLSGHTQGNRLLLFARKPAPLQVSYLGYPNTTGLEAIDYRLVDAHSDPEGRSDQLSSETLLRLPHGFLCYQPPADTPRPQPPPSAQNGFITFGCFSQLARISPTTIQLWVSILQALPSSRLLLKCRSFGDPEVCERMVQRFQQHGINSDRLTLRPRIDDKLQHLALYHEVDIALDTFPRNGTTTTCEALWMGVPVITLRGSSHRSRVGCSLLHAAGLEEFIATSPELYTHLAVKLAHDHKRLYQMRRAARARLRDATLLRSDVLSASVEDAYRVIWRRWCGARSPQEQRAHDLQRARTAQANGDQETAIHAYRQVLLQDPSQAQVAFQLAVLYLAMKWSGPCKDAFKQVVLHQPSDGKGWSNLGVMYGERDQNDLARSCFSKALALEPNNADALFNLGSLYQQEQRYSQAATYLQRALTSNPALASAQMKLGLVLAFQGKIDRSLDCFEQVLRSSPEKKGAVDCTLYYLHCSERFSARQIFQRHLELCRSLHPFDPQAIQPHANARDAERRLRIGYVSGDFRRHSVAHFFQPILAAHHRQQVEVFCYSTGSQRDGLTRRLQQLADHWRDIAAQEVDAVVRQIRDDQIDILIDLSGHTSGNRLEVFACKPAPIQVTYLGYPNTTGLSSIDYRLVDALTDPPPAADALHSESLIRLPHGFLCYAPPLQSPAVQPPPVLQTGAITFGCFNNLTKIGEALISLWAQLLKSCPQSRLLLKTHALRDAGTCNDLLGRFARHGIDSNQLQLVGWVDEKDQHLAIYNEVDIALDPYPYHGTTTTCEALWMGVPVITLAGEAHVSRVGVMLLHSVGLGEWVADSPETYLRNAIELASDPERLRHLRRDLRLRLQASPLTSPDLMAASLEDAYRVMWRRWCDPAPQDPELYRQHSREQEASGDHSTAIHWLRQALILDPALPAGYEQLATLYRQSQCGSGAVDALRRWLLLSPDHPQARVDLAVLYAAHGLQQTARQMLQATLEPQNCSHQEGWQQLGCIHAEDHRYAAAIACFETAKQLGGDPLISQFKIANLRALLSQTSQAVAELKQLIQREPHHQPSNLAYVFHLHCLSGFTPRQLFHEHLLMAERLGWHALQPIAPHSNTPDRDRPLRIGYLSGDFRSHPVATFIEPLLNHHNSEAFAVYGYNNRRKMDATSRRLMKAPCQWRNIFDLNDKQAEDLIRTDEIDILVDCSGLTGDHRLGIFMAKPAPIQVTYLGYPDTTALPTMDVRLVDNLTDPPGSSDELTTETLVRLPHGFLCFQTPRQSPPVGPLPCAQANTITFGCFNNIAKFSDQLLSIWARLLNRMPHSRLRFKSLALADPDSRQLFMDRLQEHQIPLDQIECLGWLRKKTDHLNSYNRVDIALDTFPYHGTTTTCEALWMGVPVITLAGDTHASRVGVSLLHATGLEAFIAGSEDAYIETAIDLASDKPRLAQLRAGLRQRLEASPLTNAPLFTASLEAAYRRLWHHWCAPGPSPLP